MTSNTQDNACLTQLYDKHYLWLVNWLVRRIRTADNAQDLAQDTFMRLLDRPLLVDNIVNPRAWLARIAGNLVIDQARRQTLEKNYLELLAALPEAHGPSPQEQLEVLELLDHIDALLNGLRPIEKTAFLLSRLDGLKYQEIADTLDISVSSVEKYMAKAMLKCYAATFMDLDD